ITRQTYKNLEIIVSDNCSPTDETEKIVKAFAEKDKRIKFFKHSENKGAVFNFTFVMEKATGHFFMWAADDDEWASEFVEACVSGLLNNPGIPLAFTNIEAIDVFDRKYREVPSYMKFNGRDSFGTIYRYLMDWEYLGKACLIYGVYRLEKLKELFYHFCHGKSGFGVDMSFVLATISRGGIYVDDRILFKKKNPLLATTKETVYFEKIDYSKKFDFKVSDFVQYARNSLQSVRGTKYYLLAIIVFGYRMSRIYYFKKIKRG
ncbi:MAG TPA: glycosyltransferase family 2 protein, partial [Bacteroidia bacterium]